jgi:hypothetical protein
MGNLELKGKRLVGLGLSCRGMLPNLSIIHSLQEEDLHELDIYFTGTHDRSMIGVGILMKRRTLHQLCCSQPKWRYGSS